ncbi:MAG: ABC transporter permease [Schleiferiaceae bacterium]
MRQLIFTVWESARLAWAAMTANLLRTVLSLLGIAVGIFSIISVYAVVDSLERSIRSSVQGLGSNVVYVQKWPWGGGGGEYAWWKYFQRPEVGYEDYQRLTEFGVRGSDAIVLLNGTTTTVTLGNSNVEQSEVRGITYDYAQLNDLDFADGRYFTERELRSGQSYCILGADIAAGLTSSGTLVGRSVRMLGRDFQVIGILEREGSSLVGETHDARVLVSARWVVANIGDELGGSAIQVRAAPGVPTDELKENLRAVLRKIRRQPPSADDSFALNESSSLSSGLDQMFGVIGLAGTVIGGFSILVGGFGIANIMFVSVRERTGQIGVQKALGAQRGFILAQFLLESIMLSLVGGIIGLLLAGGLIAVGASVSDFELSVSFENVVTGIGLSAVIGLIAGYAPAEMAARLDPVEAIRFNQ